MLSRGTRRADPPSGGTVVALIDGVSVGAPGAWGNRSDLTALFPVVDYSGIDNALGVLGLDTTTLTNGVHTIAWVVTDNLGSADGIGSRYFTVSNGAAVTADVSVGAIGRAAGAATAAALDPRAMAGRRGYPLDSPLEWFRPDGSGRITIVGEELDRFELDLSDAAMPGPVAYTGYLRDAADLRPLPIGSHLDQATGVFTWQPGVAFVGPYDFVFVRSNGALSSRRDVRLVLQPKGSGPRGPHVVIDVPGQGEIAQPFAVAGWAADLDARAGTGVSALHVWAYPTDDPGSPQFLGAPTYGGQRPDVADIYGQQYRDSGYGLTVQGLQPGTYDLAVFAWSTVTQGFVPAKVVRVTVQ